MRFLVAGATGFLGRRLVATLVAAGDEVWAVARRADHGLPCPTRSVDDTLDPETYRAVVADHRIDAVVNALAAGVHPSDRDAGALVAANVIFPAALVRAARAAGAPVFIHVGSSAEYLAGYARTPLAETAPLETTRLYGATKAAGSILVQALAREAELPAAVMRAFNLFGAGEAPHRLFPSLARRLAAGQAVDLSGGTQVRDFLHVDDACRAIRRMAGALAEGRAAPGVYNLASGEPVSVRDFAAATAEALGADPALLRFGALPLRPDDLPFVVGDPSRLEAVLGPHRRPGLRQAIDRAVRDLRLEPAA